eukprot:403333398
MQVMRNYYSAYQTNMQNMISFQIDTDIQFMTLYENGILPIYKISTNDLSQPIDQYFKIEFQSFTTDVQLIRKFSPFQIQLAVSLIDNEYLTSLSIVNYNWQNPISKYYQIIIDIPLNSSPYPVDRIKVLNSYQIIAISRRDYDFIEFKYEKKKTQTFRVQNSSRNNQDAALVQYNGEDKFEIDYKSFQVHTTQIGGGHYEQVLSSIILDLPQYFYKFKTKLDKQIEKYTQDDISQLNHLQPSKEKEELKLDFPQQSSLSLTQSVQSLQTLKSFPNQQIPIINPALMKSYDFSQQNQLPYDTSLNYNQPNILTEIEDNYLHPFVLLNVGFDRRMTLVKVNDKSRLRSLCASQDGRMTVHEIKLEW